MAVGDVAIGLGEVEEDMDWAGGVGTGHRRAGMFSFGGGMGCVAGVKKRENRECETGRVRGRRDAG